MSKIEGAIREINTIDSEASADNPINRLHPLTKLLVTFAYIFAVVSFDNSDVSGLLSMLLYPIVIFTVAQLKVRMCVKRIWIILLPVCLVGIANPFFDKKIVAYIGSFAVTGGMVSMFTLMIKGILTVTAAYILIITTKIEAVCQALRMLCVPGSFVTVILLIYRYVTLFLQEVNRMTQAYALRAPGQKGINYRAWGALVGQLLLRAMDRASLVYESMCLRGFSGEFLYGGRDKMRRVDFVYLILWLLVIILLRTVHIFELVGSVFVG